MTLPKLDIAVWDYERVAPLRDEQGLTKKRFAIEDVFVPGLLET